MLDDELDDATCPSSIGLSIKSSVSNCNASVWRSLSRPMTILATCIGFSTAPLRHPSTPLPLLRTFYTAPRLRISLSSVLPRGASRQTLALLRLAESPAKPLFSSSRFFAKSFVVKFTNLFSCTSSLSSMTFGSSLGPLPTASAIQAFEFCTDRCVKLSASSDHDSELVRVHASLLRW